MQDEQNKRESPRFTLAIDSLIIHGFLSDREAMFRRLRTLGFSRDEIVDRTRQLGLSAQFLKQYNIKRCEIALRICLKCDERFLSAGFQNRLCNRCRHKQ
jgi:hypothetical protein